MYRKQNIHPNTEGIAAPQDETAHAQWERMKQIESSAHLVPGSKITKWMSPSIPPIRMSMGSESISIMPVEFPPHRVLLPLQKFCFCQNTHGPSLLGPSLREYYLSCVRDTWIGQQEVSWNGISPPDALRAIACLHHLSFSSAVECHVPDWASPSALKKE